MAKLMLEDLRTLREQMKKSLRKGGLEGKSARITIGMGTCGIAAGGKDTLSSFIQEVEMRQVGPQVTVRQTGCMGRCADEPTVEVAVPGMETVLYGKVTPELAKEIMQNHLVDRRPLADHIIDYPQETDDIQVHQKQMRIALRNCGIIDPENINEYIGRDGYLALEKVLFQMKPDEVVEEVKKSGLRGRGGAGFPTGLKWETGMKAPGNTKYVVCNADEGDPGAYMDRSAIEGDPHSIIEAMIICGKAIGANQGFVYIRAEYPLAINILQLAMRQAQDMGLLGRDILGSGFDFDIEIRLGAGAFVCGEETALLRSIEGLRGMPTPKPPFPAISGLWGCPTIINNVETWANIPTIITKGADWFAAVGTADSKGTKVFSLTGKVNNSGLVEVPMGTTLREIIFEIGGGIRDGKKFKGVQTGGPSGGIITEEDLDTPIDFGALVRLGSMMGSGGMIVMDEDDCIVDVSKFYMEFCMDESCGKCSPCRLGTRQMYNILDKISKGLGTMDDLEQLNDISQAMKFSSLCALGQTAPNPTMSTLRKFEAEYIAHIKDKKCPAGKCKKLISFFITDACIGCTACARDCPVNCISGNRKERHLIDQTKCIKCGACEDACKFNAIIKG